MGDDFDLILCAELDTVYQVDIDYADFLLVDVLFLYLLYCCSGRDGPVCYETKYHLIV